MNESAFTTSIHRHIHPLIHKWKINARFANGVPDAWYSGAKADLWVEYKWVKTPADLAKPAKLSPLQAHWLRSRHSEKRNVAVIIACPSQCLILPGTTWEERPYPTTRHTRAEVARWIESQVGLP